MNKILIIDDDPDVRTLMNSLLIKQGYEVETASRKEEAMEKMQQFQPSCVLLDVLLSGSDGREICQEIKTNEQTKNIPVIMFSAHPGAAGNFKSYGADDFIAKPFTADVLLQKMNALEKK